MQPYNWHWFRIWGTGETLNNGTHEVDVCRWALGVDFPNRVTASGGRYAYKDDWQFYDTLVTSLNTTTRCSRGNPPAATACAISIVAAAPSSKAPPAPSWSIATATRSTTSKAKRPTNSKSPSTGQTTTADLVGADSMTDAHFANFIAGRPHRGQTQCARLHR